VLGPRLGKQLGEVRGLLAALNPAEVARSVNEGQDVELTLKDGSKVSISPAEILVDLVKRPGYAAAQGEIGTVVLDTDITEALLREGIARDFVRGVQDARKSAGYQIDDRIEIVHNATGEAASAIADFSEFVRNETLAESLVADGAGSIDDTYVATIEAGGESVEVRLRQVSR
jgi:isoleucyl-tRNA synthetase